MVPKSKIPFFQIHGFQVFQVMVFASFFSSQRPILPDSPFFLYVLMFMTRRQRLHFIFAGPLFYIFMMARISTDSGMDRNRCI